MLRTTHITLTVAIFLAVVPHLHAQDDKVFRSLSPEAAEAILKDLKIDYTKSSSKRGDEHYYDFKREGFKVRLTYFSPTDIMLDCVFRGISLEKANSWNTATRVSRASTHKDQSGDFTLLEYGLDLAGGATAGTIKQFVTRFDDELKKFDKHAGSSAVNEDTILTAVTDDKIENIFKTQSITFTKKVNNAGVAMFDFEMNNHKLRLYNFNGKDLMIDVHFKRISLEDANAYNLNRKFIRAVNYKNKELQYTALECNLDCEAGVSEGMIRHWINSFGEDAKHFSDYVKKQGTK